MWHDPNRNYYYQSRNQPYYNRRPPYYRRHRHHGLFTGLVTIVLIVVVAFILIGAHANHTFPFQDQTQTHQSAAGNSADSSASSSSTPANQQSSASQASDFKNFKAQNKPANNNSGNARAASKAAFSTIGTFWERINNVLGSNDGSNTNLSELFVNGDDNDSYHGIEGWLKFVTKGNAAEDTKVESITPFDARAMSNGNDTTVHYKVRYDFKYHDHDGHGYHRIQIYDWTAKFTNGSHKIQKMGSPRQPSRDFTN